MLSTWPPVTAGAQGDSAPVVTSTAASPRRGWVAPEVTVPNDPPRKRVEAPSVAREKTVLLVPTPKLRSARPVVAEKTARFLAG